VPGAIRPPTLLRPAAILLAAVLFAGCTGGSKQAADTATPRGTSPSAASTSEPEPTPTPTKSKPKPKPKPKPAGPFSFRVVAVGQTLTNGRLKAPKINHATHRAVKAVHQRFDALFRATYIDPSHWKDASYWKAFQTAFAGQARSAALIHRQKLTLGADAGKKFGSVRGPVGRLSVKVLLGPGGGPVTALVHATFKEKAARTSGGTSLIESDGRYYVEPSKRGWVIVAFRVGRHDHGL